jgi:Restriction endonuclease
VTDVTVVTELQQTVQCMRDRGRSPVIDQFGQKHPIRFGDEVVPTREFAEQWPNAVTEYFTKYRNAYRERLLTFWTRDLEQWPAAFVLASPVEAVIVGTLAFEWIFIRPAASDTVHVVEAWEHDDFADWRFLKVPQEHRFQAVANELLEGLGWHPLEEHQLAAQLIILEFPQYYGTEEYAHALADSHVEKARERAEDKDGIVDYAALAQVRRELDELELSDNRQRRGKRFEAVMERLLVAHGCSVRRGKLGKSEQVDLFMDDPQYALIECRWKKEPLQPNAIHVLLGKLRKRPAAVAGVYISMSGFTDGAIRDARDERERTIILLTRSDVADLASGRIKFRAFWRERMLDLILRYG